MKKTIVLFNLEQSKFFNHKTGNLTANHTEASTYISKGQALNMLDENRESFKSKGYLTWETRILINL